LWCLFSSFDFSACLVLTDNPDKQVITVSHKTLLQRPDSFPNLDTLTLFSIITLQLLFWINVIKLSKLVFCFCKSLQNIEAPLWS